MTDLPIGDPRKSGEAGPAGDQRSAGEEGPAGDPRPGGEPAPAGTFTIDAPKDDTKGDSAKPKSTAKKATKPKS